ncbi:ribosome maturation factor RimP [Gordonia hirsuta DSM 44140 = NBRC 16056]|uniref:Ribosome maturation factor RimP n=1 Tax=Gordonia hirsuta DSM 44140 = NBRC 16056 TaxID=1121927 RepID=L7LD44_9ACTN|nr:ribosome maturation factor RimP [Gordonia hirsuta]GAC58676.1 ribosome maturation factor RimP [Gordonia hirsuta DSM 44140 = NBRC 16056]
MTQQDQQTADGFSAQIAAAADQVLLRTGYDLEDIRVDGPAGRRRLQIIVDRDGGASLDEVADLSRELSTALDAADVFGDEAYDLEVSTPGIGRPLTLPRHWRRARGRKVTVRTAAETVAGRVADTDARTVTLLSNDKGRMSTRDIALSDIDHAVIEVDFTRPGEAELRACGLDDAEISLRRTPAR